MENEHEWFAEQIGAAIAGGLDGADRDRFDAHAAGCAACAAALAQAESADRELADLFASTQPDPAFEDRVISRLRRRNPRQSRRINPIVWRVASAAAAAVVLAGVGRYGSELIAHGNTGRAATASSLHLIEDQKHSSATVNSLTNRSRSQIEKQDYTGALGTLDQITVLDPKNDYAIGVRQFVEDKAVLQEQRNNRERSDYQMSRVLNGNEEETVPYNDILRYPDNYPVIGGDADGDGIKDAIATSIDRATNQNEKMLNERDKALSDAQAANQEYEAKLINQKPVVDKERQAFNAALAPSDFKQAWQAQHEEQTKSSQSDSSYVDATDARQKDLIPNPNFFKPTEAAKLAPANGTIDDYNDKLIATPNAGETGKDKVVTKIYDIRDLLISPTSDPTVTTGGDNLTQGNSSTVGSGATNSGGAGGGLFGGGGGMGGGDGDTGANTQNDQKQQLQDIERKIQNTVSFNTWKMNDPNGTGSIDDVNGKLIVQQSPEVQKQIDDLIKQIRQTNGPGQIAVQEPGAVPNTGSPAGQTPAPAIQPGKTAPPVESARKVIRHGDVSFEVDSFDSAAVQIAKIVDEERGFVSTTNSDKLDNGKVSGTIIVRVPPDHLDTLVLKLRGLGDLKGQKITSDDVTREYTDMQSELRAAQAMEDRLMEIVKTGKGEVKDLVEAEKELGVWREKVEKVTGEINYYSNLVAMSTLQIELTERDLRQAALATQRETVSTGIEADDVAKAREAALKAIEELKGRVTQSDLKQLEAGEFTATIVAEIAPESSGPLIDRLHQIGRVARLDVGRQQTTADGTPVAAGVKVDNKDTLFNISIYNLANIQPRQTTNLNLASADVEKTYADVMARVAKAGGRVVSSNLNRPKSDQIDATIRFETPTAEASAVLADIRVMGDVMHLTETDNLDTANVTPSKRGFDMTLASLATVKPRETIKRAIMPSGSVSDSYRAVLDAANAAGGRVTRAELQETGSRAGTADLEFEVPRAKLDDIEKAVVAATGQGKILSKQSIKAPDTDQMVDSKIGLQFTFISNDALAARETVKRDIAVPNVPDAYNAIKSAAEKAGAKIATANLNEAQRQNIMGALDLVVPAKGLAAVEKAIADAGGGVISRDVRQSPDLDTTTEDKVALMLNIFDVLQVKPRETTTLLMQVSDPEKSLEDLKAAVIARHGRVRSETISKEGELSATVSLDMPLHEGGNVLDLARNMGTVKGITPTMNAEIPDADFARAELDVTFKPDAAMVGDDTGLWSTIKSGLGTSIRGLLWSLQLIVIGLCMIVPWCLILWVGYKAYRRVKNKPVAL